MDLINSMSFDEATFDQIAMLKTHTKTKKLYFLHLPYSDGCPKKAFLQFDYYYFSF
jgi:hypothetical protein